MPNSYVNVWIHVVWTTKHRHPILEAEARRRIFSFIKKDCEKKNISVDVINGVEDHVHALIRLQATQNIASIVHKMKGASANWTNKMSLIPEGLRWQESYSAFSVSPDQVSRVRQYILNQEIHHQTIDLKNELASLGFSQMDG